MKLKVCGVLIVGALSVAQTASAAPAWCSALGQNRVDTAGDLTGILKDDDPRDALKNLVAATCKPDGEQQQRSKEIDAARAKWSQKLDLTEADWSDVALYATLDAGARMNGEPAINTNGQEMRIGSKLKRPWSSFDAIDQYIMLTNSSGASGDLALDHNYLADAFGTKLTETGRFAYVRQCVTGSAVRPVQWAMCQPDIDLLDSKKIAAELRPLKTYDGADKIRVRVALYQLQPILVSHAARVKKLIASDPGYAQMFEVATSTRKEWESRYKTDAALLELVSLMDDARATNSSKAFQGCEAKAWAAWKTAVAGVAAKKFDGMHTDVEKGQRFSELAMGPLLANPATYLAGVALAQCEQSKDRNAKHDYLLRLLGENLERWPGYRGPRTATETGIMTAGVTLDDRDSKIDYPSVSREFGGRNGGMSGGGAGVIAKLTPAGDTVTVEFKKQMVKQVQCAEVKYSNRITQITSSGTIVYEGACIRNETIVVNLAAPPQTVNVRYLDGIKPGMYVSIIEDVVESARAKPGASAPTMVFGVAVK